MILTLSTITFNPEETGTGVYQRTGRTTSHSCVVTCRLTGIVGRVLRTADGRGRHGNSLEIPGSTFVISGDHEMSSGEHSIPENVQAHDSAAEADSLNLVACI